MPQHTISQAKGREIIMTRLLNAPRELVFDVWTDPEHKTHWWGPNGFTITTRHMELKKGGAWIFTMHGPDGTDWPNKITYLEIVKPERLVYKHTGGDEDPEEHNFEVTVTFEVQDGNKTLLTMRSLFSSEEYVKKVVEQYGAIEGGKQTLARLAAFLEKTMAGKP